MSRNTKSIFRILLAAQLVFTTAAIASESDPYTYSSIPLTDAAPVLNDFLNHTILEIVDTLNAEMPEACPAGCTDTQLEIAFSRAYKHRVLPTTESRVIGIFEVCIATNDCPGWPAIDRIQLWSGESIFDRVDYGYITERTLAEIVNVCGVRMSTDKLTHMLGDGFGFYNLWMNEHSKFHDQNTLERFMLQTEFGAYGKLNTGVVSFADIEADRQGVRFFRSLFHGENAAFARDTVTGQIVPQHRLNLCDYLSDKMDERYTANLYTGRKAGALQREIEKQILIEASLTPSPELIQSILSRRSPHKASVGEKAHSLLKLTRWLTKSPRLVADFLKLIRLSISAKNRVETQTPRVTRITEAASDPITL